MALKLITLLITLFLLTSCITFGKVNTGFDDQGHFRSSHIKD